jgi:N-methylhydantoinase B/oxoprolinase/acetone carboxylase alpha subunit
MGDLRTAVASRRSLQRDIRGLVEQYGWYSFLHALVEACHLATEYGGRRESMQNVCTVLSEAERHAQYNGL